MRRIGLLVAAVGALLAPSAARAVQESSQALQSVSITATESGFDLEIHFAYPIRYTSHAPRSRGRSVRIQVDPIARDASEIGLKLSRERLPIPKDVAAAVSSISFDDRAPNQAVVEVAFVRVFDFEVQQGADFRSLRLRLKRPAPAAAAVAPGIAVAPGAETAASGTHGSELLARARHSIRDGNLDLAIAQLTRVLELSGDKNAGISPEDRMEAAELIGLTHERKGQTAHARADYEAYLKEYPDAPGATRVRQRLDALLTASAPPRAALREPTRRTTSGGAPGISRDFFGSVGARIFQSETLPADSGDDFKATNAITDMDLSGRLDANSWALRGDFNGAYDFDIAGQGGSDDLRVSRLSVEFDDRAHRWDGILGRQRRSDSGVLGRFDGVRLSAELGTHYQISALAGLPVKRTYDSSVDTHTIVAGTALDWKGLWLPGLQGQFFLIGRHAYGMTDRAAIGGEIRYAGTKTYSFAYFDYDFLYQSLNTVVASSTIHVTPDTDLRALAERRNSPVLTLSTALLGQPVDNLDDLKKIYSDSEIRDLAKDRTASVWSGTVGATQRFGPRLQFNLDFNVSRISGTNTSGGVEGTDAVGPNYGGTVQMLVNDWLMQGGVGSVSIAYYESDFSHTFNASAYARFRLPYDLRVRPLVQWTYRDSQQLGEQSRLRPAVEIDWRRGPFLMDLETGIEWTEPISNSDFDRQESYFVEAGIRWEF